MEKSFLSNMSPKSHDPKRKKPGNHLGVIERNFIKKFERLDKERNALDQYILPGIVSIKNARSYSERTAALNSHVLLLTRIKSYFEEQVEDAKKLQTEYGDRLSEGIRNRINFILDRNFTSIKGMEQLIQNAKE